MQGKHLYEYAVIRVVPRVEREEFVNVGVIMYSRHGDFIRSKMKIDRDKLSALDPEIDMEVLTAFLEAFSNVCQGGPGFGPVGQMDPASRFRWLTAQRSSMIQTSRPHNGLSADLDKTLEALFGAFVA